MITHIIIILKSYSKKFSNDVSVDNYKTQFLTIVYMNRRPKTFKFWMRAPIEDGCLIRFLNLDVESCV